ncbi:MAG: hypothetical protein AAFV88_00760 [Planctomycetota bacterium]
MNVHATNVPLLSGSTKLIGPFFPQAPQADSTDYAFNPRNRFFQIFALPNKSGFLGVGKTTKFRMFKDEREATIWRVVPVRTMRDDNQCHRGLRSPGMYGAPKNRRAVLHRGQRCGNSAGFLFPLEDGRLRGHDRRAKRYQRFRMKSFSWMLVIKTRPTSC